MKTTIALFLMMALLIAPTKLVSQQSKDYHLSYNGRIYELKEFKRALVQSVDKRYQASLYSMVDEILYQSAKHDVDPVLVVAVIHTESRFKPLAVSPKGAVGPMQLMRGTADYVFGTLLKKNEKINRFDTDKNIEAGVVYLSYLMKKFKNNEEKAVIAYNMGPSYIFKKADGFKFNHQYYNKIKVMYAKVNVTVSKKGLSQDQILASKR